MSANDEASPIMKAEVEVFALRVSKTLSTPEHILSDLSPSSTNQVRQSLPQRLPSSEPSMLPAVGPEEATATRPPLPTTSNHKAQRNMGTTRVKERWRASFENSGEQGFERPNNFVESSGGARHYWGSVGSGDRTPTHGGSSKLKLPSSAPATSSSKAGRFHSLVEHVLQPPLVTSSSTHSESEPAIERSRYAFSGYGRPNDFVYSFNEGKRKSWRPKATGDDSISPKPCDETPAISSHASSPSRHSFTNRSFHSPQSVGSNPGSFSSLGDAGFATPEPDQKPKVALTSQSSALVAAASLVEAFHPMTPEALVSRKQVDGGVLGGNELPMGASSDLHEILSPISPSPATKKRWSCRKVDPNSLPPAFRAAHRNSLGLSPKPMTPRRRHLDPSKVDRVVHPQKETPSPSRLKNKWPPVIISKQSSRVSLLRARGVVPGECVKKRRSLYENADERAKVMEELTRVNIPAIEQELAVSSSPDNQIIDPMSIAPVPLDDEKEQVKILVTGKDLSTLKVRTSMKIRWGGPTYFTIDGRPLYYENAFVGEDGNELPFAPLVQDRFSVPGSDKSCRLPTRGRSYDDWSDDDSYDEDDVNSANAENDNRPVVHGGPDVWVAPMATENVAKSDSWRVKRVWNVAVIDEREEEHEVHDDDLIDKVKDLLGVPIGSSPEDVSLSYDPFGPSWRMKKVYDVDGEIQEVSRTLKLSEHDMVQDWSNEAQDAVQEAEGASANDGDTSLQPIGDTTDGFTVDLVKKSTFLDWTDHTHDLSVDESVIAKISPSANTSPMIDQQERDFPDCSDSKVSSAENQMVLPVSQTSNFSESDKEKTETTADMTPVISTKKKKKKEKGNAMTIWDLLSPPPVFFFVGAEQDD